MKQLFLIILGCVLLGFANPETEKEIRWEIIGTKKIDARLDKALIPISFANNKSTAIRFGFNDQNIQVHHAKLYFEGGDFQTIPLRKTYYPGELTKIVDLRGGLRKVEKCEFYYYADRHKKNQPIIKLWAKTEVQKNLAGNQ